MGDEKRETIWKGAAFEFERGEEILPNGRRSLIGKIRHPGSTAVIPLREDGSVILIHQYRPAVREFVWEIPGGTLDPGETPLACVERELREECGFQAGRFELLGEILVAPWYSDERTHLYVATHLTPCEPHPDEDEILTVHVLPFDEALAMIGRGEIRDGTTILALQKLDAMRRGNES